MSPLQHWESSAPSPKASKEFAEVGLTLLKIEGKNQNKTCIVVETEGSLCMNNFNKDKKKC